MKRFLFFIFLFYIFLFYAIPAGTTYYTAKDCTGGSTPPNCSDSNNGTSRQTAKLTIDAGRALLAGGDTLIIGSGTYNEIILPDILPSGSLGNPTIIKSEFQNGAIFAPDASHIAPNSGIVILLQSALDLQYVTFDGIKINCTHQQASGYQNSNGDHVLTGITITNGTIIDCDNGGVKPTDGSTGMTISCKITSSKCGSPALTVSNMVITNVASHGIYWSGSNGVFYNNNISSAGRAGIQLQLYGGTSTNNDAYNNLLHSNLETGINSTNATSGKIYNNVIYLNGGGDVSSGIQLGVGNSGACSNCFVYHNTIYGTVGNGVDPGYAITVFNSSNGVIQNNIFFGNGNNSVKVVQDNCSGCTIIQDHNFTTDPLFVDTMANNFQLQSGSGARDVGVTLSGPYNIDILGIARPQGAAFDDGAYEFFVPPPTILPTAKPRIRARIR